MMAPGLHCKKIVRLPVSTNFVPGKRWYPPKVEIQGSDIVRCYFCLRDQEMQPHWFCPRDANWPTSGDDQEIFPIGTIDYLVHDYSVGEPGGAILKPVIGDKDSRLR